MMLLLEFLESTLTEMEKKGVRWYWAIRASSISLKLSSPEGVLMFQPPSWGGGGRERDPLGVKSRRAKGAQAPPSLAFSSPPLKILKEHQLQSYFVLRRCPFDLVLASDYTSHHSEPGPTPAGSSGSCSPRHPEPLFTPTRGWPKSALREAESELDASAKRGLCSQDPSGYLLDLIHQRPGLQLLYSALVHAGLVITLHFAFGLAQRRGGRGVLCREERPVKTPASCTPWPFPPPD